MKFPQYYTPPVSELIIGLTFAEPIAGLREKDLWAFWVHLRDKFPEAWTNDKVDAKSEEEMMLARLVKVPVLSMLSEDRTLKLMLHADSFTLNWKRGEGNYPGYEEIKNLFTGFWREFQEFWGAASDAPCAQPTGAALRYINIVTDPEIWGGTQDTVGVLPSIPSVDTGVAGIHPVGVRHAQIFSDEEETSIIIEVDDTVVTIPDGAKGLMVNISATGEFELGHSTDAETWLKKSHDLITTIFNNIASPQAKTQRQQEKTP